MNRIEVRATEKGIRKMRKIKIVGVRSIETKAMRLCCDLRDDARRVRSDYESVVNVPYVAIAAKLDQAAQLLSDIADLIRR